MNTNQAILTVVGAVVVIAVVRYAMTPSKKKMGGLENSRIVLVQNAPSLVPA